MGPRENGPGLLTQRVNNLRKGAVEPDAVVEVDAVQALISRVSDGTSKRLYDFLAIFRPVLALELLNGDASAEKPVAPDHRHVDSSIGGALGRFDDPNRVGRDVGRLYVKDIAGETPGLIDFGLRRHNAIVTKHDTILNHTYPSNSATIASIWERSSASRFTMPAMRSFSSAMSTFTRVSRFSTQVPTDRL